MLAYASPLHSVCPQEATSVCPTLNFHSDLIMIQNISLCITHSTQMSPFLGPFADLVSVYQPFLYELATVSADTNHWGALELEFLDTNPTAYHIIISLPPTRNEISNNHQVFIFCYYFLGTFLGILDMHCFNLMFDMRCFNLSQKVLLHSYSVDQETDAYRS